MDSAHEPVGSSAATCSVCGRSFQPRLSYQRRPDGDGWLYLCSPRCLSLGANKSSGRWVSCSCCAKRFPPTLAWQVAGDHYFCTMDCRKSVLDGSAGAPHLDRAPARPRRVIAVLNQKGGTGKTTTSVQLAAALAEQGERVLLVDLDIQGNVGVCLGVEGPRSAADVLLGRASIAHCATERSPGLDVLLGGEALIEVERALARDLAGTGRLGEALAAERAYSVVIIDCGPSLTQLNTAALQAAHEVLVPVSCDYLALVGVRQILKVIKRIRSHAGLGRRPAHLLRCPHAHQP